MKRLLTITLLSLPLTASAIRAQSAPLPELSVTAQSRIWFAGNSTVRAFTCEAAGVKGSAVVIRAPGSEGGVSGLVRAADIAIPVAKLECGNKTMNEHMLKALKAASNPEITFRMTEYQVTGDAVVMQGKLTIAGTELPITVNGSALVQPNGSVRVTGTKELRMTEFGVKPPSLMLGAMKVKDNVVIHFDVVLAS